MNIIKIFKLARVYSKAKKLLKKDSHDVVKLRECKENLGELIIDLEETQLEFKEEIKRITKVITELTKKIKEVA